MIALIRFLLTILVLPLRSKRRLQAENAMLRQQVIVLRRKAKGRPQLTNADRWFFVQLYRWFPSILDALTIIRPETLLRWHRAGFRQYWRWKSKRRAGRPQIQEELRVCVPKTSSPLIRERIRLSWLNDCAVPLSVRAARCAIQVEEPT